MLTTWRSSFGTTEDRNIENDGRPGGIIGWRSPFETAEDHNTLEGRDDLSRVLMAVAL